MGYFADGPGDGALRVNGLTFSETVASQKAANGRYALVGSDDYDSIGDVADGAAAMARRTIDPRRALAQVDARLLTRVRGETADDVRNGFNDAIRDLADPRFANGLRGSYLLTPEQAARVDAAQQQYGSIRWSDDSRYRRDVSAFADGYRGLDDDTVRLHALTNLAQSQNPGYAIEGDINIGRMPTLWGRDTSLLGLPSRLYGGLQAFASGPAGYGDDGGALYLNPRTHSYQSLEEIAFEGAAIGMTPTPGLRGGPSVLRSGIGVGASAAERYVATLGSAERASLGYSNEVFTVVSRQTGEVVAQQVLDSTGGRLTPEVLNALKGNTGTHNHPSGGPLGYDDLSTAIFYGASEMRAASTNGTRVLDLSRLPDESRLSALNTLREIRSSEQAAFLEAYPGYREFSAAERFKLSSQVLDNIVQRFADRLPDQVRYTVEPPPRRR